MSEYIFFVVLIFLIRVMIRILFILGVHNLVHLNIIYIYIYIYVQVLFPYKLIQSVQNLPGSRVPRL